MLRRSSSPYFNTILLVVGPYLRPPSAAHRRAGGSETASRSGFKTSHGRCLRLAVPCCVAPPRRISIQYCSSSLLACDRHPRRTAAREVLKQLLLTTS